MVVQRRRAMLERALDLMLRWLAVLLVAGSAVTSFGFSDQLTAWAEGIGTGIHFRSLSLHPYYREAFPTRSGDLTVAESVSERLLSLPLYPKMSPDDVDDVLQALHRVIAAVRR